MVHSSEKTATQQTPHTPKACKIVLRQQLIVLAYILLTLQELLERRPLSARGASGVDLTEHQRKLTNGKDGVRIRFRE
jgi:hypothetical protein